MNLIDAPRAHPMGGHGSEAGRDWGRLNALLLAAPQVLFGGMGRKMPMARMSAEVDKRMERFVRGDWDAWIAAYGAGRARCRDNDTRGSEGPVDKCKRQIKAGAYLSKAAATLYQGATDVIDVPASVALCIYH